MKRSSGILLPIFSLPSKYGIGTLGKEAYNFIDFLVDTKQSYWQVLPIMETSFGNSPYSATSDLAGNPLFIDLDMLRDDGLINESDYADVDFGNDEHNNYYITFNTLYKSMTWKVFSIYSIDVTSDYLYINFESDESYQNFINLIRGRSNFAFDTEITTNDKMLTLSTCLDNDKRLVVHAVLVESDDNEEEKAKIQSYIN